MLKFLLFILFFSISVSHSKSQVCYLSEPYPYSSRNFETQKEYDFYVNYWKEFEPQQPNPLLLLRGWLIAKEASQFARQNFADDKKMHCYVGCKVSQNASFQTAVYAGWLKEYQDLTDCKSNSGFSPDDYEATIVGGRAGTNKTSNCLNFCYSQ